MIRTFAAIDIGSSGLELGIYELSEKFGVRSVEQVRYPIALGKDTWHSGKISYQQVDEMCEVLAEFARIMKGYQHSSPREKRESHGRQRKGQALGLGRQAGVGGQGAGLQRLGLLAHGHEAGLLLRALFLSTILLYDAGGENPLFFGKIF